MFLTKSAESATMNTVNTVPERGSGKRRWSRKPPDSGADYLKQYTKLFLTL